MAYKVFISYSAGADQVIALRLQALASVYGFEGYVRPAQTRFSTATLLREKVCAGWPSRFHPREQVWKAMRRSSGETRNDKTGWGVICGNVVSLPGFHVSLWGNAISLSGFHTSLLGDARFLVGRCRLPIGKCRLPVGSPHFLVRRSIATEVGSAGSQSWCS
jgi:hypothetical protein